LLGGGGMADRDARVLAEDMRAEQRPRRAIGDHHAAVLDEHHRCDDRIEDVVEHRRRHAGRVVGGRRLVSGTRGDQRRGDPADQRDDRALHVARDREHRDRSDDDDDDRPKRTQAKSGKHCGLLGRNRRPRTAPYSGSAQTGIVRWPADVSDGGIEPCPNRSFAHRPWAPC
jgi:hypothetical protein